MNVQYAKTRVKTSSPLTRRPRYMQANRPIEIFTQLGADKLLLSRFQMDESLSHPFEARCEMYSDDPQIDVRQLLKQPVSIRLDNGRDPRYFHALVREVKQLEADTLLNRYAIIAVPQLWFLSLKHDCRIFQDLSVDEIVTQVLGEQSIPYQCFLHRRYHRRNYCVQYRESSLHFISRLMEEEGIYFYFKHESDGHTMVIADHSPSATRTPGCEVIHFHPNQQSTPLENVVYELERQCQASFDQVTLNDFNYEKPGAFRNTEVSSPYVLEMYDYPGDFETRNEAERKENLQIEEYETVGDTVAGKSTIPDLTLGTVTALADHFTQILNREYLLTSIRHTATNNEFHSCERKSITPVYANTFQALPRNIRYRPERKTPRPVVKGSQTAIVVGPKGKEIYTDEYGRVKVQFHWDRRGNQDSHSSCWIRVSQPWAGGRWGAVSIPRIGQEVIVDFLEGNPDRPIITGRVFNADQMPPYHLPAGQNLMGMRSQTVNGAGYNEMVVDDTAGAEMVRIRSQHNMQRTVLNDDLTEIGNMQSESVGNCKLTTVAVDETSTIGNNKATSVVNAYKIDCDTFELTAKTSIKLHTGASTIKMNQAGVITITGNLITVTASVLSTITAPITSITGGILLTLNGALTNVISNVTNILASSVARVKAGKIKLNC